MKKYLLLLGVLNTSISYAQDYQISFSGSGESTLVATVKVENLTQGTNLVMTGSDVLHLKGIITGIETVSEKKPFKISFNPNPMTNSTKMQFLLPEHGETIIAIYDFSGRKVLQIKNFLLGGQHSYSIEGIGKGIYFVKVISGKYLFTGRLIWEPYPD